MQTTFSKIYHQFIKIIFQYDFESSQQKLQYLRQLKKIAIPSNHLLEKYTNALLFLSAHPADSQIQKLCDSELRRISAFLKKSKPQIRSKWDNSGLPFTNIVSNFSIDLVKWIYENNIAISLDSFDEHGEEFKSILNITLPQTEKEYTAIEDENEALLNTIKVPNKNRISFLISEFDRLSDHPLIKDYLFDQLNLTFKVEIRKMIYSKLFNRLSPDQYYYHEHLLKRLDHQALLNTGVSTHLNLAVEKKNEIIRICKIKLMLLQRETEPVSYMDENSLRYYVLERGISIALYTMKPERQLPIESYVGYTLFRNGYPAAYGGAWLMGKRALFGINIFDWFRGGESGYILCQLLRLYRQVFSIDYFEVEPYQYGLGNPEGIKSGAFWFYYKFGFRPLDKYLKHIAEKEQKKISTDKTYKTSGSVLEKFTESNIALNLSQAIPVAMWQIRERISKMIHTKFNDNRAEAERICISLFKQKAFFKRDLNKHQLSVLTDFALMSCAYEFNSESIFRILEQMILDKPMDVWRYHQHTIKLFSLMNKD